MSERAAKVYVIGMGPGTQDYLLPLAKEQIEKADCLIGAERHLALFRELGKEEVIIDGHLGEVLPYIKKYKGTKRLAVLVSGDPGLYSLSENIFGTLNPKEYAVIPGISTIQLAFSRIGKSWHDAKIVSLHGRKADNLSREVKGSAKAFIFTDPNLTPGKIAGRLLKEGVENRRAVILENLSYSDEKITDTDLSRLSKSKRSFGLCAMIIERYREKAREPKLYGVGIGPGEPGLVTLKAKEILDRVDTIFAPKSSEDGTSCARSIVEAVTHGRKNFVELTFPMTKNKAVLNRYWTSAAKKIAGEIEKGKETAFVTIGDPFIYSTYAYLLKTLRRNFPDIAVETVPGISAFNAASAKVNFTLVEGNETLAVIPVRNDLDGLRETIKKFDTVVLMKVGSKLNLVLSLLKEMGLADNAFLISRVGHKDERIWHNLSGLRDKKAGYLSVIIVKKGTQMRPRLTERTK